MTDIFRMGAAVGPDRQWWELSAWKTCALLPGFDRVIRDTCWEMLSADVADQWLALFHGIQWDEHDDDRIAQRWRAFLAIFPDWHRGLVALSGQWQSKYVSMLHSYVSGWENPLSLQRSVAVLLPLQRRLCQPPFSSRADGDCVLSRIAEPLPAALWQQLATLPDQTWLIAERACRRDNDATLIGRGLFSLSQCWPDFLMSALSTAPARLMRSARLLGCLAYDRRRQFLADVALTAWFAEKWTEMEPYGACRRLYRLCLDEGITSPVPRRLREHFEASVTLTPQQVERHCRVSMARLPTVLLAALEQCIWSDIDAPFSLRGRSTAASHAVLLLAGLDSRSNRKGLRRFLLDYCKGRQDAYLDHPRNRAWFARHPRIDVNIWRSNPTPAARSHDAIQVSFETDPLEILMMGTYVGTCLGLGGICDFSSVACLLDANKQVVYARDSAGRVMARQLVAIDERERLVCFAVYPATAGESIVSAFGEFDRALAQALGIDVYRNVNDEGYDLPLILAQDWYDDGVWEDTTRLARVTSG